MNVTGTDTTCTVSIKTIRTYNHAIQDLDACNELADSLYAQKERYKGLSRDLTNNSVIDNILIKNYEEQIIENKSISDIYKTKEKSNETKLKIISYITTILGITTLIETAFIYLTYKSN